MDSIITAIDDWIKSWIIGGIIDNLTELFDTVNAEVGEIATEVGKTPSEWQTGVFSFIQNLSETVIIPIAGVILTFVMCQELISMIVDRNNMQDFPPSEIFKWLFKTCVAVLILTNSFNFVVAVFEVTQNIVNSSAGVISGDTAINIDDAITSLETAMEDMEIWVLGGMWLQSFILGFTIKVLAVCIFIVINSRMMEIYMVTSLAPIPFATLQSKELGSMGQNYIKSISALGIQAFLIMVCVGIYSVLIQNVAVGGDPMGAIWECMGYTFLLTITLFKTGSIAKSVFNAH